MDRTPVISPSGRIAICGAALAIALVVGWAVAAEPAGGATEGANGVLVLRNGNVLPGQVTKLSGYYRIELGGSSFRVPADQVEISCGTVAEAYEIRRSRRAGWSADSHVDLATWCLRNNLPDQAAREILDVRTTDPSNSALAGLETQLKQAFDGRAQADEAKTHASAAPVGSAATPTHVDEAVEGGNLPDVDVAEQAQFVRNIQPMLIHSCATGGCHAASAAEPMRLDRWALDGGGNPMLVRRNLAEVLAQINSEDPEESPLLRHGHVAHGRGKAPRPSRPLDARQTAILKFWIDEVCGVDLEAPATPTADAKVQPAAATVDDTADEFDPAEFNDQ
jgi:hypothetical protein